jgi:hypothetical protein
VQLDLDASLSLPGDMGGRCAIPVSDPLPAKLDRMDASVARWTTTAVIPLGREMIVCSSSGTDEDRVDAVNLVLTAHAVGGMGGETSNRARGTDKE